MIPNLRHAKTKGEYAEAAFIAKAIGLGFTVSCPFGDNHRFDFLVFSPGSRIFRVQVKSSWSKSHNCYYLNTKGCHRYHRRDLDFIVGYVVPENAWYVVPVRFVRSQIVVFPHIPHSRGRLEPFRERWDLLRTLTPRHPEGL